MGTMRPVLLFGRVRYQLSIIFLPSNPAEVRDAILLLTPFVQSASPVDEAEGIGEAVMFRQHLYIIGGPRL